METTEKRFLESMGIQLGASRFTSASFANVTTASAELKIGSFSNQPYRSPVLMFLPPIEGLSASYSLAQYLDIT